MVINFPRKSKVSNFKYAIMEQNILRLDIPMNNVIIIKNLVPFTELS